MPSSSSLMHHGVLVGAISYAAFAPFIALNFAIRRDFRRAALLGWMTPFPATRSSVLTALFTAASASGSPARIASSAFFTNVRAMDRYGRFLSRFRSAMRIRFKADLLFANEVHPSLASHDSKSLHSAAPTSTRASPQSYQFDDGSSRKSGSGR